MSTTGWFAIKLDNEIQIAERAATHEEALKLARARVAKWEGAPKCVAVGLLVLLAATDDLEGWFTAAEIDARADEDTRAADAAHDGDGEPYPVTMRDVGVRP